MIKKNSILLNTVTSLTAGSCERCKSYCSSLGFLTHIAYQTTNYTVR